MAREEEQHGWCCRVNKVDCLIGRQIMNVVVIHSLKGHGVFLLICGQPWLTCCHFMWCMYSHECMWSAHGSADAHAYGESIKAQTKASGDRRLVAAATRGQRRRGHWRTATWQVYGRYTAGTATATHSAVLWAKILKKWRGRIFRHCWSSLVSFALKVEGSTRAKSVGWWYYLNVISRKCKEWIRMN